MALNSAALGEAKQRGAGSDLDVIGMGCKAHQFEWAVPEGSVACIATLDLSS